MKEQNKQLLLIDLCARLPYGVIVDNPNPVGGAWDEVINIDTSTKTVTLLYDGRVFSIDVIKPYLRPMSSMTEEEQAEFVQFHCVTLCPVVINNCLTIGNESKMIDWLLAHHFDYRIDPSTGKTLIESNLAIEAPEGMYKNE